MKKILVTGGAGYIGSHTVVELVVAGYEPIIVDNFSNSSPEVLERIETIIGKTIPFFKGSISDKNLMNRIFEDNHIDAVIHLAAYKSVEESVGEPLKYYENNVSAGISLLDVMEKHKVEHIIFSSSATVYGMNNISPLTEDLSISATNPYGHTKLMMEQILTDLALAHSDCSVTNLRYFNPIGAHESGLIGEAPNGIPHNLMPYITQVAVGKLQDLSVFGNDYDTHDGTGVRDYIHVVDLAKGHVLALKHNLENKGVAVFNLGTGIGYSVLDMVKVFENVNGVKIPYTIKDRRHGDVATCYADASKANDILGWKAEKNLQDMMRDSWRWQSSNPNGYEN